MNYAELLQAARGQMGPCRACPVCNGRACGGNIPGPGAKGSGTVAIRNFDAWRNVRLNMDTIHENFTPDTSLQLFGRTFKYPFFAGPVGAMTLHYGDKYNDMDYNAILVPACAAAGIASPRSSPGITPPLQRKWRWHASPAALRWPWTLMQRACPFCRT